MLTAEYKHEWPLDGKRYNSTSHSKDINSTASAVSGNNMPVGLKNKTDMSTNINVSITTVVDQMLTTYRRRCGNKKLHWSILPYKSEQ